MSCRNMTAKTTCVLGTIVFYVCCVSGLPEPLSCSVFAKIETGWMCGVRRLGDNGFTYASFRGVPYAQQPLGHLRFKELQQLQPWEYMYDASEEGPVCPQRDFFYGPIMRPQSMSESCIHANIHVPIDALPRANIRRIDGELEPYHDDLNTAESKNETGLPILVFIHGGGFTLGSGDSDLYGPEFLVTRGIIVITFNYRLGPFGFLSLNSTDIPGNNGLRDQLTLLRWVQRNARAFGGDPNDVTLGGQSAGGAMAHLLSLNDASKGLFKRIILMSGVAVRSFFTASPLYARYVANQYLVKLGIDSTDPAEIHKQLIEMPLEKIAEANTALLDEFGFAVFVPVVESPLPGVTRMLEAEPEELIAKGKGKDIPALIGYTTEECETFRLRFTDINIMKRINKTAIMMLSPSLIYSQPMDKLMNAAKKVQQRYFMGTSSLDSFLKYCTDNSFIYPAMKLAELRAAQGGAPAYLYQFSYEAEHSILQEAIRFKYRGAAHIEDIFYVFRTNSILGPVGATATDSRDEYMKELMTTYFINFIRCSDPTCNRGRVSAWPPVKVPDLQYQDIENPYYYRISNLTKAQRDLVAFLDSLYNGDD